VNFPYIGQDPLKTGQHNIEHALDRLRQGASVQQKEVPDQTMLAWRIDVDRVLVELTWRRCHLPQIHVQNERIAQLVALLDRVPHHGPQGSYSKAEGQCWPDCVACEWEQFKQHIA